MDQKATEYFARIVEQARAVLESVVITTEITPDRSILRLIAEYGRRRVVAKEILTVGERHYSYYVLRGPYVEAGFDNSSDPKAIRLKFGHIGADYEQKLVPHLHTENKQRLMLTDEIDFSSFLEWLVKNVPNP